MEGGRGSDMEHDLTGARYDSRPVCCSRKAIIGIFAIHELKRVHGCLHGQVPSIRSEPTNWGASRLTEYCAAMLALVSEAVV